MNTTSLLNSPLTMDWPEIVTTESPEEFFNFLLGTLVTLGITAKAWPYFKPLGTRKSKEKAETKDDETQSGIRRSVKPREIKSLQKRFLPVFYLLRMSFWMSGPYFFQVYSSKTLQTMSGSVEKANPDFVSRVSLVGYLAIVILGPTVGKLLDRYGRKKATIFTGLMYAVGSLSVFSNRTLALYAGRAMASIASSRLASTPEAWLIGEYLSIQKKRQDESKPTRSCWLSEIFGMAYGGDSLVAILAGQIASRATSFVGNPTGPFLVSFVLVGGAALLILLAWSETKIEDETNGCATNDSAMESTDEKNPEINSKKSGNDDATTDLCQQKSTYKIVFSDSKIILIGLIQSLFEGSMYIFVLVWPPIFREATERVFGSSSATPYGTIFSCFMACALLGSVCFAQLQKWSVDVKIVMMGMLVVSTASFSLSIHALQSESFFATVVAFFAFEACVGMYFPSIGTIRIDLLPESHRTEIMALFAVPLNILVVGVMFFQSMLGHKGALTIAGLGMGIATACMILLRRNIMEEKRQRALQAQKNWSLATNKIWSAMRMNSLAKLSGTEMEEKAACVHEHQRRNSYIPPAF